MAIHSVQSRFAAASFLKHSDGTYDFDFSRQHVALATLGSSFKLQLFEFGDWYGHSDHSYR